MRDNKEIKAKFDELVAQRDACDKHSAARKMLNNRVLALGWVLNHPKVPEIKLSDEAILIYDCVS